MAPGPTSGEVRTRRWGHYRDVFWHNLAVLACSCHERVLRTPKGRSTCCQIHVLERSPQGGEGAGLGYGTKLSSCLDLDPPRERALLPRTRLLATVASGLRRSGLPEWT